MESEPERCTLYRQAKQPSFWGQRKHYLKYCGLKLAWLVGLGMVTVGSGGGAAAVATVTILLSQKGGWGDG